MFKKKRGGGHQGKANVLELFTATTIRLELDINVCVYACCVRDAFNLVKKCYKQMWK